jgi:hypothetical protein
MLHEFVTLNRDEIIGRCRAKVASRSAPPPTDAEIDHGVPMFLDQLVDELRLGLSGNPQIADTARQHGHDLLHQGFTMSQVVHDYGDVCQSITELAVALNAPIDTDEFRMLNRCLDDAIAGAVTEYGRASEQSSDQAAAGETERVGRLALDLRHLLQTASVTLEVVKSGSVGITGNTGTLLAHSIVAAQNLADLLVAEVDATRRTKHPVVRN